MEETKSLDYKIPINTDGTRTISPTFFYRSSVVLKPWKHEISLKW